MEYEENVRAGGVILLGYRRLSDSKMGTYENIAEMFDGSEKINDAFNSQSDRLLGNNG